MSLLAAQRDFRTQIMSGDEVEALAPGMAIYRNAYRGRLTAVLEARFKRTRQWVGADSFAAAASHYILSTPPRGWTLDEYGDAFADVLAVLFRDDAEVGELAWLEWHLQRAFGAVDVGALDVAALGSAGYSEAEWDALGFTMAAGFVSRPLATNSVQLWEALEAGAVEFQVAAASNQFLAVWRADLEPRYRVLDGDEFRALRMIAEGAALGQAGAVSDAPQLGTWLTRWFAEKLFAGVRFG